MVDAGNRTDHRWCDRHGSACCPVFVGAVVGEVIARGQLAPAARVGFGTWLGLIAGALAKLALVLIMVGVFVTSYLIG